MSGNNDLRKNGLVLLGFLLVSAVYFAKAFAHKLLPSGMDVYYQFYPVMKIVKEQYLRGQFPFWNPYMFSGFPLMAGAQHAVLYPVSMLILLLLPVHLAYLTDLALHYALAGFFTYLYARKIGIETFPSFSAGVVFAFVGYLTLETSHLAQVRTAVWLPLILYFLEDVRVTGRLRSTLFASLALALQIYAGHPQIYFYTYLIVSFFFIFYLFQTVPGGKLRFICLGTLAAALGLLLASPQLYATYQLSSLGIRPGLNYAIFSSFSLPLSKIPFLFVPSPNGMWTQGYIGWLPALLAVTAFVKGIKGNVHVRFWGIVAIISLALSLGNALPHLNRLMFHVPIYNNFRGPSKHILEFSLAVSILFALGFSAILKNERAKEYLSFTAILLLPILLLYVLALIFQGTYRSPSFAAATLVASMGFTAVFLAGVLKYERHGLFKYVVALLIVLELVTIKGAGWISVDAIDSYCAGLFRIFSGKDYRVAFFGNGIVSPLAMRHCISLVDGYDPLILKDYNTLFQLDGIGAWSDDWPKMVKSNRILSMMNVRFVVLPSQTEVVNTSAYRRFLVRPPYAIYENLNCLPRAFSVSELVVIKPNSTFSEAQILREALLRSVFNPVSQAAVTEKDLERIGTATFTPGSISVLSHTPDRVLLRTDFKSRGFAVLSDTYYPGWQALTDGRHTKIYKVDGVLRGVVVPPGVHELQFVYRPVRIYILMILSLVTLAGIMITLMLPSFGKRIKD